MTTQGLVVGSFCLATFLLVGCEDGLALIKELKDHKGGGAVDPGKDPVDPGKPCVTPPDGGPACTSQVQGGDTSCKDVGVWKQYAWESCEQAGLVLTDYAPYEGCGETDGSFRFVKYTCCKPTPTPPPPPTTCETRDQGGSTSCKSVGTWKQYAGEDCAASGLQLTAYSPGEACGDDSYRFVKYTCCKPTSPTPPPPSTPCETRDQGGSTSCKSVGTWKQYAGEDCAAAGLQLTAYTPVEACGDDSYRFVKYTCCK